ncbi:MAG TPA: D-aminoacyl-tRNA deacylase [Candidatus Dormibacteraeota bacterium]
MRLVVQRVAGASVSWTDEGGEQRRTIGRGLAILVGAGERSDEAAATRLAAKIASLRIFPDADGRFNLSLTEVGGEALVVSQFTLYADLSRGRRPGFTAAGDPARARALCDHFAAALSAQGVPTQTGSFGAHMLVEIANQGPVTLVLSSDDWPTRV